VRHAAGSKSRKIVVYCTDEACDASTRAAKMLTADGYGDVAAYEGGLTEWQDAGAGLARAGSATQPGSAEPGAGLFGPAADAASAGGVIDGEAAPSRRFESEVQALRERARRNLDDGAVTAGYTADRVTVLKLLNTALATELVCVLRYKRHQFMAQGIHARSIAAEFLEHATEELGHADQLAERIVQLGGEPDFSPDGLSARSHAEYREGTDLPSMLKEDLVAERIAIESYGALVRYLGEHDPTTRRMIEQILATEEEHADDLASLLKRFAGGDGR
jgi:bacterioferritin